MNRKHLKLILALLLSALLAFALTAPLIYAQGESAAPQEKTLSPQEKPAENGKKEPASNGTSGNLFTTFRQGGILMWPILLLGLVGLTIIIERTIYFLRNRLWDDRVLEAHIDSLVADTDARFREELDDEINGRMQNYFHSVERGMALLNGVGNLAPVIGFFGTVQGMIGAFAAIAAATTVNAKVVAVGIQIALITTAGGLAVAVPTLAFFHLYTHFIQTLYAKTDKLASQKTGHLPRFSWNQPMKTESETSA